MINYWTVGVIISPDFWKAQANTGFCLVQLVGDDGFGADDDSFKFMPYQFSMVARVLAYHGYNG